MTRPPDGDPAAEPLRLGLLGAARITELAVIKPAKITGTRLVAVAARDPSRAAAFAEAHGIERVHESYLDVINDPDVEAVYNPLANSLHAPWNKAALAAGKHVFTEKPSASNAAEAEEVATLASTTDRQFFEGFHYLWHPLVARLHAVLASGELGELRHVETVMDMPAPDASDPRWSLELRGGTRTEHLGRRSSYTYQLEAFTTAVRTGVPARTDAADAVRTMRLIDQCYEAIGLQPRPSHTDSESDHR